MTQQEISAPESGRRAAPPQFTNVERPLGEIVEDIWSNTEQLVRQELDLVLAQLDRKTARLKADVGAILLGGAVVYAGVLAIIASVILLLSKAMDPWVASLLVGAAVSVGGFLLVQRAKKEAAALAAEQVRQTADQVSYTAKEIVK